MENVAQQNENKAVDLIPERQEEIEEESEPMKHQSSAAICLSNKVRTIYTWVILND